MLLDIVVLFGSILEISIFGYFFYVTVYNLILSLSGLFKSNIALQNSIIKNKIGIFIPAYKEDAVIINSVNAALEVDYPKEMYHIVVIADSMHIETIAELNNLPIKVIEATFVERTKVKAIQFAIKKTEFEFDVMIILDADNIIEKDFLIKTNNLFNQGYKIVQGRRLIKNPQNHMAVLDDLSEQINNHINRKGTFNLGGSSSIAGSGFAVDYLLGKEVFNILYSIGGFDKEFELLLLERGYKTTYSEELIVYDEKVETGQVFKNQRRRWMSSQYAFLKKYFNSGVRAIFHGDFVFFNSTILRNVQLPRLLNLGLFSFLFFLDYFLVINLIVPLFIWAILYVFFLMSVIIAIPKRLYNFRLLLSIVRLPGIFFTMFFLMFKLRGANRKFIHTPHGSRLTNEDE